MVHMNVIASVRNRTVWALSTESHVFGHLILFSQQNNSTVSVSSMSKKWKRQQLTTDVAVVRAIVDPFPNRIVRHSFWFHCVCSQQFLIVKTLSEPNSKCAFCCARLYAPFIQCSTFFSWLLMFDRKFDFVILIFFLPLFEFKYHFNAFIKPFYSFENMSNTLNVFCYDLTGMAWMVGPT